MTEQKKVQEMVLSVRDEFKGFRDEMLVRNVQEVFNNHAQIHFYCRVNEYFGRDFEDFDIYEKKEIVKLRKTVLGNTLSLLWDYYSDCENPTVESYLDIYYLIKNYNERYAFIGSEAVMG